MSTRVLVSCFGSIYSFSQKNWARWLAAHARGEAPGLGEFNSRYLGDATNVTDVTPKDAVGILDGDADLAGRLPVHERKALEALTYNERGEKA